LQRRHRIQAPAARTARVIAQLDARSVMAEAGAELPAELQAHREQVEVRIAERAAPRGGMCA
jgi:hypothetical protein